MAKYTGPAPVVKVAEKREKIKVRKIVRVGVNDKTGETKPIPKSKLFG